MSKFLICKCCNQRYLEEDMSKNDKNLCCGCWCYVSSQERQISDLEAKLAEKDVELNKWSTEYARAYVNRQNDLIAENVELKQQLAEKDEQLKLLKGNKNE